MCGDGVGESANEEPRASNGDSDGEPPALSPPHGHKRLEDQPDRNHDVSRYVTLKRDRIDLFNAVVLFLAFCAAVYAGYQGKRLANLTQVAIDDARIAAKTQHQDTLEALQRAKEANTLAKDIADRQAAATETALAISQTAANAAQTSANELIAERRPFIGVSDDDIVMDTPLTFKSGWATIGFKVTLRNVGKSVATNVTIHESRLQLEPLALEGVPFSISELSARLHDRTHCSEQIVRQYTGFGTMILPGGTWIVPIAPDPTHRDPRADLSFGTDAWLTFCISYSDDNNRVHATGAILYFKRDKQALIFPDDGIVAGKMQVYPFGGSNAF